MHVASVSGGKDSTALYCWAIDQFGRDGFRAVFADTGHEHPVTYNYVRNLSAMAGGPEIQWVKADFGDQVLAKGKAPSGNPFLDLMLWKGRAPSTKAQFCTEHIKLQPIRTWLEAIRSDEEVTMFVGIRAGESERRSKMPPTEWSKFYDCEIRRPLLTWSESQVFEYLEAKGVPPNPLYEAGFSRVGCFPCIHARKSELARLPGWAWEKLLDWEKQLQSTWFAFGTIPLTQDQGQQLLEAEEWKTEPCSNCQGTKIGDALGEGDEECEYCCGTGVERVLAGSSLARLAQLRNEFSPTVQQVREWATTSRGGRQFELFAEDAKDVPSCMSTWGACE